MSIEKERKAFEEWAYSNKWNICRYPKSDYHMKEGQYCDEFVDGAWHGWIKSANREGYKLVPIDNLSTLTHWTEMMASEYGDDDAVEIALNVKAMIGACDDH